MTKIGTSRGLGHEKLHVYQRALEYVAWSQTALAGIEHAAIVLDHWDRAAESIVENIANGNSRRTRSDRNQYFDVAIGSALECAACLDICRCRKMISETLQMQGKKMLQPIVRMTIVLREAESAYVREESVTYSDGRCDGEFAHERLEVYKVALELVAWFHRFLETADIGSAYAKHLDKVTTSLVLNIAEGNGRFSSADQKRFIDIAHTCAMRVASCLDVLVARRLLMSSQIVEAKHILSRVVPLVLGLRGYLEDTETAS